MSLLSFGSPRGHQPIRWPKNRDTEDRLDVAAISDPDLRDHRLNSLALRQRSILQGALDMGVAFEDVLCHVVHVDRSRSVLRAPGGPPVDRSNATAEASSVR